jgi:hypothetical protein
VPSRRSAEPGAGTEIAELAVAAVDSEAGTDLDSPGLSTGDDHKRRE